MTKYPSTTVKKVTASLPKTVGKISKPKIVVETDAEEDNAELSINLDGHEEFRFTFEATAVPYCCGIIEFGEFFINKNTKEVLITEEKKVKAIKDLIKECFDLQENRTVIINLIDDVACRLVDKALIALRMFTKVKTFKNPGSGRIITMWISNN